MSNIYQITQHTDFNNPGVHIPAIISFFDTSQRVLDKMPESLIVSTNKLVGDDAVRFMPPICEVVLSKDKVGIRQGVWLPTPGDDEELLGIVIMDTNPRKSIFEGMELNAVHTVQLIYVMSDGSLITHGQEPEWNSIAGMSHERFFDTYLSRGTIMYLKSEVASAIAAVDGQIGGTLVSTLSSTTKRHLNIENVPDSSKRLEEKKTKQTVGTPAVEHLTPEQLLIKKLEKSVTVQAKELATLTKSHERLERVVNSLKQGK